MCGVKDEGLIVALQLGAGNRTTTNVIPGDVNSLAFSRTEREILRSFYGTGNATLPGGIFPHGVNGEIAEEIVRERLS
ncbi:desiccation-related protein PCC13-62-like protein [Corchorus capsularis]|uniref:Desiccation-related protein PCC13-62-like protein n=1 Tax=Corchorus capsularis TaxID=210143 RepID=A0A1R3KYF7_COCAP|nr:desiccation-related protein PCC13-62-like protein [Corchorus capsularis]